MKYQRHIFIILSLTLNSLTITAQDSLYLVGTLVGESYEKRITNVRGVGDVNGDGYGDFLVAMSEDNTVHLYFGSPDLNLESDVVFTPQSSMNMIAYFGADIAGIGDVNGDGYDDFTIAAHFHDWGSFKGIVFLYYGGETISPTPVAEFYEPWIQDGFGHLIVDIGDINKDGYNDFTISSSYNWSNGRGRVYLFWGGDTISFERSVTFLDTAAINEWIDSFFGESVANIGDINGNGYDDIAISAGYDPSVPSEKIYVFYGSNQMIPIPDTVFIGGDVFNIGDINGDQKTEFVIRTENINIYFSKDSLITLRSIMHSICGGDINNDGYSDLVIGDITYRNSDSVMVGAAFIFLGSENFNTDYSYKLEGETKWSHFSTKLSLCDINGDGLEDLLILADGWPENENPQGKLYIYSYKNLSKVEKYGKNLPSTFEVYQNYPNPFNSATIIRWQSESSGYTTIRVYDILGREKALLFDGYKTAGLHDIEFDASKYNLGSGIYFCEIRINGSKSARIRMVYTR
jgi:hypothetical protein